MFRVYSRSWRSSSLTSRCQFQDAFNITCVIDCALYSRVFISSCLCSGTREPCLCYDDGMCAICVDWNNALFLELFCPLMAVISRQRAIAAITLCFKAQGFAEVAFSLRDLTFDRNYFGL